MKHCYLLAAIGFVLMAAYSAGAGVWPAALLACSIAFMQFQLWVAYVSAEHKQKQLEKLQKRNDELAKCARCIMIRNNTQ